MGAWECVMDTWKEGRGGGGLRVDFFYINANTSTVRFLSKKKHAKKNMHSKVRARGMYGFSLGVSTEKGVGILGWGRRECCGGVLRF